MSIITHTKSFVKIPTELRSIPQWIVWKYSGSSKVPVDHRTGRANDAGDSTVWMDFDDAVSTSAEYDGIGLYLTEDLGLTCIDADDEEAAENAVSMFPLTYAERSPSGVGCHVWMYGSTGGNREIIQHDGFKYELYRKGRFITFTGNVLNDYGVEDCEEDLRSLYDYAVRKMAPPTQRLDTPVIHHISTDDDSTLIEKIRNSRQGAKFVALYDRGDTGMHGEDVSRASAALVRILVYWTNGDPEQMDRLFRGSALMRDKWDSRRGNSTWGRKLIEWAISSYSGPLTGVPNESNHPVPNESGTTIEAVPNDVEEASNQGVPNGVDWDYAGGETDRRVVALLVARGACDGAVAIGEAEMERELGITRKTIRKSIRRLLARFGEWFKRNERADIFSSYSYEVSTVVEGQEKGEERGTIGGEMRDENGLATGKEEDLLLTNYVSGVDTVGLEHIEDSLNNQESPLLQETRTEYPQDKEEGQQAPTPPTRIHHSVTSYEDRTSGLSDNQTEEGSTSEQDHDKDRDSHRVDVRPDNDTGAASHEAHTSATIVAGGPGRSHGIKLVEPQQFGAPVFQPNVQGQVVGAAIAMLYSAAHALKLGPAVPFLDPYSSAGTRFV